MLVLKFLHSLLFLVFGYSHPSHSPPAFFGYLANQCRFRSLIGLVAAARKEDAHPRQRSWG